MLLSHPECFFLCSLFFVLLQIVLHIPTGHIVVPHLAAYSIVILKQPIIFQSPQRIPLTLEYFPVRHELQSVLLHQKEQSHSATNKVFIYFWEVQSIILGRAVIRNECCQHTSDCKDKTTDVQHPWDQQWDRNCFLTVDSYPKTPFVF